MKVSQFLKKHGVVEGDHVAVEKGDSVFKGTIIPSSEETVLSLKMDNGYNVGLVVESIRKIEKLSLGKPVSKPPVKPLPKNPSLPTVLILHTGGTIASRVDYRTGAVFASFTPEDLVTMFPRIANLVNIESRLLAKMWSEDIRFVHYSFIAKEIQKEIRHNPQLSGIIIAQGTDTLAYTSAALAFCLKNLPIPVLLVGAQRSSDRGSSDAEDNLVSAIHFLTKTDFCGIGLCMHENENDDSCAILPATKTRKLHTSRRDAFKPVNDSIIARVSPKTGEVLFLKTDYPKKNGLPFEIQPAFEDKVALVKLHPNFSSDQLKPFLKYKGLVLEGTGLGQAPTAAPNELSKPNLKNRSMLEKIIKNGCVVVMTSQCIFGRVHMHVYDKAVDLENMGIIPGEDMLPETCLVKLSWLLGHVKDKNEVKRLVRTNLVGEISAFTPIDNHV